MSRFASLFLVGAVGLATVSCGDDGGGSTVAETTQPSLASIDAPTTSESGAGLTVSVSVSNPDDVALVWSASSETLTIEGAATLIGTNTGATLSWETAPEAIGAHTVELVATFEGGELRAPATLEITEAPCLYPERSGFARGLAFPEFSWEAELADGTPVTFDLNDFYCNDEEWGQYDTLLFLATADWCPNCPAYMQYIDALSDRLEAEGMLIFYLDMQTRTGATAYTPSSNEAISRHTPNGSGLRAGDGNNSTPNGVINSGLVEFFPMSWVIRRSDMTFIADQRDTSYYLPLAEIAIDPTADWSEPPRPEILPVIDAKCGVEDEEEYEPNNRIEDASTIPEGTPIFGGVCDLQPDYYYIDIEGEWELMLEFTASVGDLDVYVWDVEAQRPLRGDGASAIGSATATDNESFAHAGPAYIYIAGYRGETTPYVLTVNAL